MLDKIRGMFNKGEEARRMAQVPDEKDAPRTKNPDLDTWLKESGEEGVLDGETQEFTAANLKPKLELVQGGKSEVQAEPKAERVDERQRELLENLNRAQTRFEAAQAELDLAQSELDKYQNAKESVEKAA